MQVRTFDTPQTVAEQFATDLSQWMEDSSGPFNIALSGGSTPKILFQHWAQNFQAAVWEKVHFYWGDERCVPPDNSDSNFGVTNQLFFEPSKIPATNIHRVLGESEPVAEAVRYSQLIANNLVSVNDLPQFDVVLLGMGTDGHTASIFPDQMQLLDDDEICAVATHPDTGQKRVTMTGKPIANAKRIAFLITGQSKKDKFASIQSKADDSKLWPATQFIHQENTIVYVDKSVIE